MRKKIQKIGILFLFISLSGIFIWKEEKKRSNELKESFKGFTKVEETKHFNLINPPVDMSDSYWKYKEEPFLTVDFKSLKEKNEDVVGWIQIKNTEIDYPIVKGEDNEFYLKHDFEKKKSNAGWIFMDYRNDFSISKNNIILYGHGRLDGIMFGGLLNFFKEDWFQTEENHLIKISTEKENRIYQIVSFYTIRPEIYYLTTFFENQEMWNLFLSTVLERSIYDFSTSLNKKDELLTLSTCQNGNQMRIVVHAKLIKKEIRN